MTWYSTPLQPLDPVVVSQTPKPPIRYMRDNFTATGQNSYVKPPAQDQSMWQALTNVMPITQGILNQRWGYTTFAGLTLTANRLYNFQSDALGTRTIITAGLAGVTGFNENGTVYNSSIFTPVAASGIVRSLTSRNYQYFCDGDNTLNTTTHRTGDSLKWNGAASGGVTNIGINVADLTPTNAGGGGGTGTSVGPNTGSLVLDVPLSPANGWTNPGGIFTNSPATAAFVNLQQTWFTQGSNPPISSLVSSQETSDTLEATGFDFTSFSSPTVTGIQVAFTMSATAFNGAIDNTCQIVAQIMKNGAPTGSLLFGSIVVDGTLRTVTFGGPTVLWGSSFVPSDITNSGFGVQFYSIGFSSYGTLPGGSFTFGLTAAVSYITITVFGAANPGTSTTSGNGVGIENETGGGGVSLVIGRTYYLVANNSLTGHFSDLSSPSATTGPCQDTFFTLLLAEFNDPQVDTKYLLATADGGDPSILYEVPVIIGTYFSITSWAIVSNVITFTGTFTGTAFANGTTVTVQGLTHGDYLNGVSFTVTGHTGTTFTAAYTAANDSATETALAGTTTFAIPNNVTTVIDNTPDPTLVLDQPLLYTDTSGNEYGVTLNDPPPAGTLILKHQGRLWMSGVPGATHSVFFSKSVTELTLPNGFIAGKYEEAWPGSNYFDVSDGAESVSGLLSDGTTLYIGTQNHIRRLIGNSPATFQEPQIVHPEVGLINQEVWQITFMQGAPSGSIWMTPDFKVIQSDFNTYVDIGTPVQNILNNLQSSAQTLAHAAYVADGEYDLYILAVPYLQSTYCDTHLVFDLRARQWFVWQPASGSTSLMYNITQAGLSQWLFLSGTSVPFNLSIATITRALSHGGSFITATLTATALPFTVGDVITVAGVADSSYDGTFAITSISGSAGAWSVRWTQTPSGGPPGSSTGGNITGNTTSINIYNSTSITDNGTTIPVTAQTTWMHLGEPTRRKMLNEIQVYGNTGMTMNVYGANNLADFSAPRPVVYSRPLIQSPFGTWNLYLTGAKTRHRYYQFTFNSVNGQIPLLGSYGISAMALDDL